MRIRFRIIKLRSFFFLSKNQNYSSIKRFKYKAKRFMNIAHKLGSMYRYKISNLINVNKNSTLKNLNTTKVMFRNKK